MKPKLKYIKSLNQIGKYCKIVNQEYFYKIFHSTGRGGGIHVPISFIKEYFGTGKPIAVIHRRTVGKSPNIRKLYIEKLNSEKTIFYSEWFEPEIELEDDLFEI